jgi:hypothetical protein
MNLCLNKRAQAGDQLTVFIFFFLLMVVAAGIVIGVFLFYGKDYDFRYVDAETEIYIVKQCISENTIDWNSPDDFYSKCNLNKKNFQNEMTFKITENGKDVAIWKDVVGCELASKNIGFPRCVNETFSKTINGQKIDYYVLLGSNQNSKRVET